MSNGSNDKHGFKLEDRYGGAIPLLLVPKAGNNLRPVNPRPVAAQAPKPVASSAVTPNTPAIPAVQVARNALLAAHPILLGAVVPSATPPSFMPVQAIQANIPAQQLQQASVRPQAPSVAIPSAIPQPVITQSLIQSVQQEQAPEQKHPPRAPAQATQTPQPEIVPQIAEDWSWLQLMPAATPANATIDFLTTNKHPVQANLADPWAQDVQPSSVATVTSTSTINHNPFVDTQYPGETNQTTSGDLWEEQPGMEGQTPHNHVSSTQEGFTSTGEETRDKTVVVANNRKYNETSLRKQNEIMEQIKLEQVAKAKAVQQEREQKDAEYALALHKKEQDEARGIGRRQRPAHASHNAAHSHQPKVQAGAHSKNVVKQNHNHGHVASLPARAEPKIIKGLKVEEATIAGIVDTANATYVLNKSADKEKARNLQKLDKSITGLQNAQNPDKKKVLKGILTEIFENSEITYDSTNISNITPDHAHRFINYMGVSIAGIFEEDIEGFWKNLKEKMGIYHIKSDVAHKDIKKPDSALLDPDVIRKHIVNSLQKAVNQPGFTCKCEKTNLDVEKTKTMAITGDNLRETLDMARRMRTANSIAR